MDIEYRTGGGRQIFLMFVAFFGMIIVIDGVFTYTAIHTNTGVVTENAYEKGLAYNKVLETAKAQPSLRNKMTYENGTLQWILVGEDNLPLRSGKATVLFVRPVKDGNDFSVQLMETSPGVYEANTKFPMKGLWTAKLDVTWNGKQYQTAQDLIAR